jgi:hypothetical protein
MKYTVKRNDDPKRLASKAPASVVYDDLHYADCPTEEKAVIVCSALNACGPAIMHARGAWLEARTCRFCGARTDFEENEHVCKY